MKDGGSRISGRDMLWAYLRTAIQAGLICLSVGLATLLNLLFTEIFGVGFGDYKIVNFAPLPNSRNSDLMRGIGITVVATAVLVAHEWAIRRVERPEERRDSALVGFFNITRSAVFGLVAVWALGNALLELADDNTYLPVIGPGPHLSLGIVFSLVWGYRFVARRGQRTLATPYPPDPSETERRTAGRVA